MKIKSSHVAGETIRGDFDNLSGCKVLSSASMTEVVSSLGGNFDSLPIRHIQ